MTIVHTKLHSVVVHSRAVIGVSSVIHQDPQSGKQHWKLGLKSSIGLTVVEKAQFCRS